MLMGYSAYKAALYSILSILIILVVEKRGRIDIKGIINTLARGGRSAVMIAVTCAAAGIVIGVSNETGIGVKFASIIINFGKNNLLLILPMVMISSIILGMGLPTSACYIMVAAIAVPALIKMGCSTMASHLFALYFGVFSGITPPVAISAYAAAGIAKASPMKTGWLSVGIALPAFLIPYVAIFNPAWILEGTILETIWVIFLCLVAIVGMAGGVIGCVFMPFQFWQRIVLVAASIIFVVVPDLPVTLTCLTVTVALLALNKIRSKKCKAPEIVVIVIGDLKILSIPFEDQKRTRLSG